MDSNSFTHHRRLPTGISSRGTRRRSCARPLRIQSELRQAQRQMAAWRYILTKPCSCSFLLFFVVNEIPPSGSRSRGLQLKAQDGSADLLLEQTTVEKHPPSSTRRLSRRSTTTDTFIVWNRRR